ncbi:MAG TPA: methyltransferase domain-containing protein [Chitinophaga sp.]|uniref:class I SAM-dependent methyltransferase n=1 Tax=Chitinophaga sp. TaxID=1869181 RepID=UPI002B537C14|nr:methyltransferase domain-containing protein [Chitinophaga sp.]HVI44789.1 methyltransferase domain-containing protein [Chitinophaga sp.]
MKNNKLYVQYGCGPFSAPEGWKNFDSSPTLRIQQLPLIGKLVKNRMHVTFPSNVILGDILSKLPDVADNTCDGIYCSHVLEHLAYHDCMKALQNTCRMLKPGGLFRCVVPDLETAARNYLQRLSNNDQHANTGFLDATLLGRKTRSRGMKYLLQYMWGNREHLYMWDHASLSFAMTQAGFKDIRPCRFNDSRDEMFRLVEEESRFNDAVALEATK